MSTTYGVYEAHKVNGELRKLAGGHTTVKSAVADCDHRWAHHYGGGNSPGGAHCGPSHGCELHVFEETEGDRLARESKEEAA